MKSRAVIYKRYDFFSVLFDLRILGGFRKEQRALVAKLRPRSRTLTLQETAMRLQAGHGTLIFDSVYAGWPGFRFWWCHSLDGLEFPSQPADDELCPPEDERNYDVLTDEETGIGLLVETAFYGHPLEHFLEEHLNGISSENGFWVNSWFVKWRRTAD